MMTIAIHSPWIRHSLISIVKGDVALKIRVSFNILGEIYESEIHI
jgi:hypothetical protein